MGSRDTMGNAGSSSHEKCMEETDYSWFLNDDLAATILGDLFTADEIAEEEED